MVGRMVAGKNQTVLARVRELRGLELVDVADCTGIGAKSLEAMERGETRPSGKQLTALAQLYGVRSFYLLSDTVPNVPDQPLDFRKKNPEPARISARGLKTISFYERVALFSQQIADELKTQFRALPRVKTAAGSASALATLVRAHFAEESGLDLANETPATALLNLRLAIEAQGIIVAVNDAPIDDFRGFFLDTSDGLPVIFVNRKDGSKRAQLFTLAHEYCHALLGQEGISNPFKPKNDIERYCNTFAAEFIAPTETFRARMDLALAAALSVSDKVQAASEYSLLSWYAAAIRLRETGYISQPELSLWIENHKRPRPEKDEEDEKAEKLPINASHAKRISELGYLPSYLAATAVQKEMADSVDVQVALSLSEKQQDKAFSLATRRFKAAIA